MAYRAGYSLRKMKINLPTKITLARILMVVLLLIGLAVITLMGKYGEFVSPNVGNTNISWVNLIALIVFVIASASDALDGYLARKLHQITDLGKFLDPIADKMLVNSMLIFFIFPWSYAPDQNVLMPAFCVILMVIRDLVVDTLRFVAAKKNAVIAANPFGKIKTVLQMIAIPAVMLNGWPFSYFDSSWPSSCRIAILLVYLATLASLVSGIIYFVQNVHVLKEGGSNE